MVSNLFKTHDVPAVELGEVIVCVEAVKHGIVWNWELADHRILKLGKALSPYGGGETRNCLELGIEFLSIIEIT